MQLINLVQGLPVTVLSSLVVVAGHVIESVIWNGILSLTSLVETASLSLSLNVSTSVCLSVCQCQGQGQTFVIAPLSRQGHHRGAQVHGAHQAASHIPALNLSSHSRYSFTDHERMEG